MRGHYEKTIETIPSISTKPANTQNYTTHKRFCNNLQYVHSEPKDCKSNNWNPRDQENQVRVVKPDKGHQLLSEEILTFDMLEEFEDIKRWWESNNRRKGQTTNYKMTNNDQQKSSLKSALSVIGVW
jgi:hypothetical protein